MTRRSLINGSIFTVAIILGVFLINVLIKAACYTLLAMFKYPLQSAGVLAILLLVIVIGEKLLKTKK